MEATVSPLYEEVLIGSYLPVHLLSAHLKTGKANPQNKAVSSCPTFPPFLPINPAIGEVYHAVFIPSAAPKKPNAKAPIAPHPNGSNSGLAHAFQS